MSDLSFRKNKQRGKAAINEPDIVRRHRPDYMMVVFMVFLMMLGLVMIYSITTALSQRYDSNFVGKQMVYLTLGVISFLIASRVSLKWLEKNTTNILLASVGLSVLMALLGALPGSPLVTCFNGACRWYDLGIVSFQPAELLKLSLMLYLAVFLAARARMGKLNELKETLLPVGGILAAMVFLVIVVQKDMGTGLVLLAIMATVMFVARVQTKFLLGALGVMVGAGLLLIVTAPHRIARVLTFISHSGATDASNYHIEQALIAIGSGGFLGKGLGQSVQAFGYLPEAANDSIFAVVGEVFGFLGTFVIMTVFAALIYRLILVMDRSVRPEFKLLMAGIVAWVGMQAVINIAAMIGVIPLTGITLPFLSFGGTSLLSMMFIMGLAFNISQYTSHKSIVTKQEAGRENTGSRRRVGGSRHPRASRYLRA